jgi:formate dehydrogenase iron-sulfur subunit
MAKAVLVDLTRCIGCRGCQVACKQWNERKGQKTAFHSDFSSPAKLNADTYTRIRFVEAEAKGRPVWSFVKEQCFHCQNPACVAACPVGALQKSADGPVCYDFDRCVGCRYCMIACPFGIPKYEWDKASNPWVQKCGFCAERIAEGGVPACVKTCPTSAMRFDSREQVVAEAKRRIAASPGKYVSHIYGLEEAGGTSWIYISGVPFEQLGFRMNVPCESLPDHTWNVLASVPLKAAGLAAVLGGIAYLRNRGANEEKRS